MRAAVYATPAPDSALNRLASDWLGRDAFSDRPTRPADSSRDPFVAEAARYGFHATLRAPFCPKDEVDLGTLVDRLGALCAGSAAPVIGQLTLGRLGDFFALVPAAPEPALHDLEGDVLAAFEPYRAPLTANEMARRRPERLSLRQRELLERWGYPFVREEFRFHMTLTGPVPGPGDEWRTELETRFAPLLGRPLAIDGLGLFVEAAPGAPFRVHSFHPFRAPEVLQPAGTP
ncbi:MAG: DUF1045 domain-containing protein [Janthinobacterium lividum]